MSLGAYFFFKYPGFNFAPTCWFSPMESNFQLENSLQKQENKILLLTLGDNKGRSRRNLGKKLKRGAETQTNFAASTRKVGLHNSEDKPSINKGGLHFRGLDYMLIFTTSCKGCLASFSFSYHGLERDKLQNRIPTRPNLWIRAEYVSLTYCSLLFLQLSPWFSAAEPQGLTHYRDAAGGTVGARRAGCIGAGAERPDHALRAWLLRSYDKIFHKT